MKRFSTKIWEEFKLNKKSVRISAFMLSVFVLTGSFIGCTKKEDASKSQASATSSSNGSDTSSYPIKTNVKIKYWADLNTNVAQKVSNLGDTPFAKGLTEKTGVSVEYIHPAANQAKEQLNIMLSSGDLPDIIEYNWFGFAGGPEKAIKDGYILKLNDTIDKYSPNLKKYLKSNPEVDKMVKTDEGNYYVYPFIRGDNALMVFYGPMLRKDWLDELGMQVPTTIDEWYTALKAFKDKKGAQAPLVFQTVTDNTALNLSNAFVGAFGVGQGFYMDNGKVKFGPAEPAYKDFLTVFRKWYSEGLIDKDIATVDGKIMDANIGSNKSGATLGYSGSTMGRYISSMKEKNPKFDLVAAPYPSLKKGEVVKFGQMDLPYSTQGTPAITTKCKNVEIAARFLDYGYSQDGIEYYNFGTEGVAHKTENGYPKYTDLLMKNPDKLPPTVAMGQYIRGNYNGPFVQDKKYIEQYLELQQQKDAINIWMKTDAAKTVLPRITPTPEESAEMAKIMNEINAYVNENFFKMVLGTESIDNFNKYTDTLKKMNLDRALQIQQNALDRYNKR